MYAIVQTSGKQYRVEEGTTITVDRIKVEEGQSITLDNVLMVGGKGLKIGNPTVEGAQVTATVKAHTQGDKKITFKFRRRQRTRRRVGFRAALTTLEITKISA